jgi:hypothetical protein
VRRREETSQKGSQVVTREGVARQIKGYIAGLVSKKLEKDKKLTSGRWTPCCAGAPCSLLLYTTRK